MTLVLEGGQKVVFKPRRILELRRTPIAVGRMIDLNEEIKQIGRIRFLETFFTRDENICFYGKCLYCHGRETGVCAKGSVLEGTLVLWLPEHYTMKLHKHPWARTYKEGKAANIRRKTWLRLLVLQDGILSEVLDTTLTQDPLNNIDPILATLHLEALDRRLKIVLDHVQQCFHKYGPNKMLIQNR